MIKKLRDYTFSNKVSLQERRFALAGGVGCAAILAVLFSVISTNQGAVFAAGLLLAFLIVAATLRYTLKSKNFTLGSCIIIIVSNLIVLPVGYLLGGGIESGAPLWFVIGIVFVFVLFKGTLFWVFLILSILAFGTSMAAGAIHPEWVVSLQEGYSMHIDSYIAMLSVSILCGLLFRFQSNVLERQLKKAEEQTAEIEKLNEQQNSFFSSMSHEIRTPISTIIGLNEMTMREKTLPTEVMENTLNIQNASKMLLSLINDLLDMSKIQSGKMEIVPTEYDTSRMLSEITNLHWNRAMEKNLSFDIQVGENIPPLLYGDENRIKQVIINLLSNAIKYTDEGSVIFRFGGEKIGEEKFLLSVEVEDTGMGIRKENIQYLFDAFRRVEGEETKNIEGTGLGLSIAKQLVDLMGGTISVNSIYTKGSIFRVEIPQGIVAGEAASFKKPGVLTSERPEYQQTFEAPNASVLVVDDNDMNRIVCRKLLRSTRVKVDLAESGRECLEKTREKHYDAIFMDHEMPQMDGIETLHRIRQQSDGLCRETPVVALTANAGSDMDAFYLEKGFSAYISKPIQSSRLEAILMACLPEDLIEQQFIEAEAETAIHISGTAHKRPFIVTTDSISDLPVDITGQYEIRVMPYYISTGHGRFRDIEEIDADNLQQTFVENISGVSSEAAPVEEYETFFGNALAEARYVIHLSSSKNISEAYNRAAAAAESFGNVKVIDSGTTSTELGLMAIRTAEMLRQGMRMEEIDKDLEQYKKKLNMDYLVSALLRSGTKYKAGFLPRFMMNVFNLEPVFNVRKGRIFVKRFLFGYVRTTHEQFIRSTLMNNNSIKKDRLIVTFSGCSPELRKSVLDEIERYANFNEVIINKSSAATFINCGPGAIGLTYEDL